MYWVHGMKLKASESYTATKDDEVKRIMGGHVSCHILSCWTVNTSILCTAAQDVFFSNLLLQLTFVKGDMVTFMGERDQNGRIQGTTDTWVAAVLMNFFLLLSGDLHGVVGWVPVRMFQVYTNMHFSFLLSLSLPLARSNICCYCSVGSSSSSRRRWWSYSWPQ